jgi:hypothetical protein
MLQLLDLLHLGLHLIEFDQLTQPAIDYASENVSQHALAPLCPCYYLPAAALRHWPGA